MANEEENKTTKSSGFTWKEWWLGNKVTTVWNWVFPREKIAHKSRQGEHEVTHLRSKYYNSLLAKNLGMIQRLTSQIEGKWKRVEHAIYGGEGYNYEKDTYGKSIVDKRRRVSYFRDSEATNEEAKSFETFGTVQVVPETIQGVIISKIIPDGRVFFLPDLGKEEIIALGSAKSEEVDKIIKGFGESIQKLTSTAVSGFDPHVRSNMQDMVDKLIGNIEELRKGEQEHAEELTKINSTLKELEKAAKDEIFKDRPTPDDIRFAHTYKVIQPKALDKRTGREKTLPPDFQRKYNTTLAGLPANMPNNIYADEVAPGLDENGYPLEVFEHPEDSKNYYVLVDRWWEEIGMNHWQEATIKGKRCGEQKWRDKVDLVRAHPTPHDTTLNVDGVRYERVRKVPDPDFVIDLDPLDKICFMSNEWDSYRDDYRDGRWHKHTKTSMCYILERKATPQDPIKYDVDTKKLSVRIKFIPIYYTKGNFPNWDRMTREQKEAAEKLIGNINPRGGEGSITNRNIPADERKVSRIYNMDTNFGTLRNQVRKPSHLNPAFDRAALNHEFIHWGRMFYYEGVEGINKWSENPFPHITSRGIGKYIIDLVLRSTFSYKDARELLKGEPGFDYGVRHYDPPFTFDPLGPAEGPGGALHHGRVKAGEGS